MQIGYRRTALNQPHLSQESSPHTPIRISKYRLGEQTHLPSYGVFTLPLPIGPMWETKEAQPRLQRPSWPTGIKERVCTFMKVMALPWMEYSQAFLLLNVKASGKALGVLATVRSDYCRPWGRYDHQKKLRPHNQQSGFK